MSLLDVVPPRVLQRTLFPGLTVSPKGVEITSREREDSGFSTFEDVRDKLVHYVFNFGALNRFLFFFFFLQVRQCV